MKPLSKEASAALSALKPTDPTSADEARVRKNLERALGIAMPAATVAVATTAATAQAATGAGAGISSGLTALGLGAKALVFVAAVGVGSMVTVGLKTSLSPRGGEGRGEEAKSQVVAKPTPTPKPVEATPIEVAVAEVAPAEVEVAPAEVEVAPEVAAPPEVHTVPAVRSRPLPPAPEPVAEVAPQEPETPEVIASPPPPPPPTEATYDLEVEANFPSCDAATEMRSAMSARKLLTANRAEEAVWLLGAYQRRCASGRWSDEAWSVRMAGLCKLDRNAEVIGLLQWFSSEYPARRATVVAELRRFCPDEVLKHGE